MIGWTEEKWIEILDRWLERTARYERALRKIAAEHMTDVEFDLFLNGSPAAYGAATAIRATARIAREALEDE